MPLSTTATVTPWPLVRSHTLLKPSARCAHGSAVRRARPRCDMQFADGCGMPRTGFGGPGGAARCVGGGVGGTVALADREGFGEEDADTVGVGVAAAAAAGLDADAPAAPARTVSGTSAEIAKPEASAAPANRLIPGLPERSSLSGPQL